jgi:hypothetical protein
VLVASAFIPASIDGLLYSRYAAISPAARPVVLVAPAFIPVSIDGLFYSSYAAISPAARPVVLVALALISVSDRRRFLFPLRRHLLPRLFLNWAGFIFYLLMIYTYR